MASNEIVPALEAANDNYNDNDNINDSAAAARDNAETSATTTTTTTKTAPVNTATDNIPSSSLIEPAVDVSAVQQQTEIENIESESKENKDTEIEDKPSPSQQQQQQEQQEPAAESITDNNSNTNEDTPVSTAIATPSAAQETPAADAKKSEDPEVVPVTEGEASDQSQAVKETEDAGPELVITLLLTTGARHPFRIDKKYLRRRSVAVDNDDPFNMSVYTLKELIWREWRSEWEPQPSSPSLIRLISFGKLLDDKSPLSESSLTHDAPNVIHMTVKPQEVVDEEDAKGGKSYSARDRETTDRSPGCRCIIL